MTPRTPPKRTTKSRPSTWEDRQRVSASSARKKWGVQANLILALNRNRGTQRLRFPKFKGDATGTPPWENPTAETLRKRRALAIKAEQEEIRHNLSINHAGGMGGQTYLNGKPNGPVNQLPDNWEDRNRKRKEQSQGEAHLKRYFEQHNQEGASWWTRKIGDLSPTQRINRKRKR